MAGRAQEIGTVFKKDQKAVMDALEALDEAKAMEMKAALEGGAASVELCLPGGTTVTLASTMISVKQVHASVTHFETGVVSSPRGALWLK